MCYWAPPAAISQKWALRAGQQTHTLVLISKEQLCSVLVNISSLSIVIWWFKIAWPKWLLSIIGLTFCAIKRRCVLLQILCVRVHTHFLVPTVSKDPLLCALNKQSLFEVELPELWGRRWWRMRAKKESEREGDDLLNEGWIGRVWQDCYFPISCGEWWKGHGIAQSPPHTICAVHHGLQMHFLFSLCHKPPRIGFCVGEHSWWMSSV